MTDTDRYAHLVARYTRPRKTHLRAGGRARCGRETRRQPLRLADDLGAVTCEACKSLALTGNNHRHSR